MAIPTFRIFNGRSRGLGQDAKMSIYMQMSVGFRDYLHHFKGARLAAFIAIALHSNEEGWAEISLALLSEETGYNIDTLSLSISKLCEQDIDGHRVLLVNQPRDAAGHLLNNRYLIFPTPEEIKLWESDGKYARKVRTAAPLPKSPPVVQPPIEDGHPSDEDIGLFTDEFDKSTREAAAALEQRVAEGKPLVVKDPKPKKTRTKKVADPLFHVVKAWWQAPTPGPNRVIVDHGKDGKSIERIVAAVRGLKWGDEVVEQYLQECFEHYTSTGPAKEVEFWAGKINLGMLPERLQIWFNTVKLPQQRQQHSSNRSAGSVPFVPTRRAA
jgi:hypothetical protein